MANFIWASGISSGGDPLNAIDAVVEGLQTGDMCIVDDEFLSRTYKYNAGNTDPSSEPETVSAPNGGTWELQSVGIPHLTQDPSTPKAGQMWIRTDTDQLCIKTSLGILRFEAFSFDAD